MELSLSIGIDSYLHLRKTPYSENDSIAFDTLMKDKFKVDFNKTLLKNYATRTSILSNLEDISKRLDAKDRLMFFFAGHGANFNGIPHISCYDSESNYQNTWISIVDIIEMINIAGCKKNIYFIDACESTIQIGSRNNISKFTVKELENNSNENSYTSVFSSTSHKGIADINPVTKHGIWTNFLLKALSGEDEKALDNNLWLTNKTLQKYLSISVKEYCRKDPNISVQNSFSWGKEEGEYIIKKFLKKEIALYQHLPRESVERLGFNVNVTENIKKLPGFLKGSHFVPKLYNSTSKNFVKTIAEDEISLHIETVSKSLRKVLGLKANEINVSIVNGAATFECPYLTYHYWVELNPENLSEAIFTAELYPIDLEKIIENSNNIDDCFPIWFDNLTYSLEKKVNIKKLIDTVESTDSTVLAEFEIDYDATKTYISIYSKKLNRLITIYEGNIDIKFQVKETIPGMIDGLKEISNQLLIVSDSYKLLG